MLFCSARRATYGAVASMLSLADGLVAEGHRVEFGTFARRGLGAHVRSLGYPNHEFSHRVKVDPLTIVRLARRLRTGGFDLLHAHLSTSAVIGSLAAKLAGIPSVATVHGLSGRMSFAACTRLIAVSGEVRRHLIAQGVSAARVAIVPNGVVLPTLTERSSADARAALGLPPQVPLLGTVARLTPLKGVDHALRAMRRIVDDLPQATFVAFGDGEQEEELRNLAVRLGLRANVVFAGYRPNVASLLPGLDVFLFPTLREAMGIAVVEAMAAGLPVVASDTGGVPEIVTPATGRLVPPADPLAMAEAALGFLRDRAGARAAGQAGRERVGAEFTARRMTARTVEVYRSVFPDRRR